MLSQEISHITSWIHSYYIHKLVFDCIFLFPWISRIHYSYIYIRGNNECSTQHDCELYDQIRWIEHEQQWPASGFLLLYIHNHLNLCVLNRQFEFILVLYVQNIRSGNPYKYAITTMLLVWAILAVVLHLRVRLIHIYSQIAANTIGCQY